MLEGVRYVSFAGAGTRGMAYGGFLDAVEDHASACGARSFEEWRLELKGVAGTSAGAVAALLLALGVDRGARRALLAEFGDVSRIVKRPDMSLLYRRQGFDDGCGFRELVNRTLTLGGLSATSTLGDLRRLLRVDFVCACTDLATGRALLLRPDTHPTLAVADAIYASACVPFLFVPPVLDGTAVVVDGCMSLNHPAPFAPAETLLVSVDSSNCSPCEGDWPAFLQCLVGCAVNNQPPAAGRHAVHLHLHEGTPSFDMNLTYDDALRLSGAGYAVAVDCMFGNRLSQIVSHLVGLCARAPSDLTQGDEGPPADESLEGHDVGRRRT